MPQITLPQVSRVLRALLPQRAWTDDDLLAWLSETHERNERSKRSHAKRRASKRQELSL